MIFIVQCSLICSAICSVMCNAIHSSAFFLSIFIREKIVTCLKIYHRALNNTTDELDINHKGVQLVESILALSFFSFHLHCSSHCHLGRGNSKCPPLCVHHMFQLLPTLHQVDLWCHQDQRVMMFLSLHQAGKMMDLSWPSFPQ